MSAKLTPQIKTGQKVTVKMIRIQMKSYRNVSWIASSRIYSKNHSDQRRAGESRICRKIEVKK
jgi:hypothetical protein